VFVEINMDSSILYDLNTLTRFINFLVTTFSHEIDIERKYTRCFRCRQRSFSDTPLCDSCFSSLQKNVLVEYLNNFDPSIIANSSFTESPRAQTAEILFDLKHFEEAPGSNECKSCHSKKNEDYISPSHSFCEFCNRLFDWRAFGLDYMNRRITWEEFFKDRKKRSKYIYDEYKTREEWLDLGECV